MDVIKNKFTGIGLKKKIKSWFVTHLRFDSFYVNFRLFQSWDVMRTCFFLISFRLWFLAIMKLERALDVVEGAGSLFTCITHISLCILMYHTWVLFSWAKEQEMVLTCLGGTRWSIGSTISFLHSRINSSP